MAKGSVKKLVLKSGETRYQCTIDVKVNGRWKTKWKRFKKRKWANDWLAELTTDCSNGSYRELKRATLQEYIEIWKPIYLTPQRLKPSTIKSYDSILKHMTEELGHLPLTAITPADIDRFAVKLQNAGKTHGNILRLLGKILKNAIRHQYLRHSPMEGYERPRRSRKQRKGRALNPEEIQSLLEHFKDEVKLIVETAILTGMRQGELFGVHWEDFDWENSLIHVHRSLYWDFGKDQPKNESGKKFVLLTPKSSYGIRDIDLSPRLKKQLQELWMRKGKPETGFVFTTEQGTPVFASNLYKREFKPVVNAIGLEGLRWHDLRHTFGSLKLAQGADIFYIQRQMGHSSIQITCDIYGHQLNKTNPEAAAKTDDLVFGKKKG